MEEQVISKARVADHGEVLTAKREVDAMLDLVKQETENIDASFLEPACGNGNFLTAILERKIAVVDQRYCKSQLEFERYAFTAVASLYGIDILADHVSQCRERLFSVFDAVYERLFPQTSKAGCRDAIRFVLAHKIVWGDALAFETGGEHHHPIVFPEPAKKNSEQLSLFAEVAKDDYNPKPVADYSPVSFLELGVSANERE